MNYGIRQILLTLLVVFLVFGLMHVTLQSYEVNLSSMEPSFHNGQRVLVEKVTYRFHSPSRGDIIVFDPPIPNSDPYIKRIIGVPDDEIFIEGGKIYINGYELQETPNFPPMPTSDNCSLTVPKNRYFVLGDNRTSSYDSPDWGQSPENMTVAIEDIIGRVWIRYWPLSDLGLSPSYSWIL